MEEHDNNKKDWFKEVFFLTINTDCFKQDLDTAQLDYLELEFYNRVPEGIRTNVNKPQETYMEIDRENNLNELIKPVPLLMKVLGRGIFNTPQIETPPPPPPTGKMVSFHRLSRTVNKKYHVVAFYEKDETSERYTVLKGSNIVPWNANDETRKESGRRKYLCAMREKWAKSSTLTLTEDVPSFNSASQAAMFVTGNKAEPVQSLWKPVTEEEYRTFLKRNPPEPEPEPEPYEFFQLNTEKPRVEAHFKVFSTGGEWKKTIVLKGSVIAEKEHPDNKPPEKEARTMRKKHFTKHPGQCELEEDWEFGSPTPAVSFVMGYFKGGPEFMIREGSRETLKAFRDAQKQAKGKESLS